MAHVQVRVVVTDKNDNAPIFVNTPYYGVISVEAKRGDVVFRVSLGLMVTVGGRWVGHHLTSEPVTSTGPED